VPNPGLLLGHHLRLLRQLDQVEGSLLHRDASHNHQHDPKNSIASRDPDALMYLNRRAPVATDRIRIFDGRVVMVAKGSMRMPVAFI